MSGKVKDIGELQVNVPSPMSSEEWANVDPRIRLYSFFSARVEDEHLLDLLRRMVEQAKAEGWPPSEFANRVKELIGGITDPTGAHREDLNNMSPEERARYENDVRNIDSRARLELIYRTQLAIAAGVAQFQAGMTPMQLFANPGWQFLRQDGAREEYKRKDHVQHENEVRLKTDFKFWLDRNRKEIGGFMLPHAPFGFNSWMRIAPVSREKCVELGLIGEDERLELTDEEKAAYGISGDGSIPEPDQGIDPSRDVSDISDEGKAAVKQSTEEAGGEVVPDEDGGRWTPRLPDGVAPKPVPPAPAPAPQPAPVKRPAGVPEDVEEEDLLPWMLAKLARKPKRSQYKTDEAYLEALEKWRKSLI